METIKNMCYNTANTDVSITNNTNKLSDQLLDKSKQILNDLGLEDISDIEQLNQSDFANIETETDFEHEEYILAKMSKAKTSNKKPKQMYTNSN